MRTLFYFLLLVGAASTTFNATFKQFLVDTYGQSTANDLESANLGAGGSFGGGDHVAGTVLDKDPVILVHGSTNKASNFEIVRQHFKIFGNMTDNHIYATSYGNAGVTPMLSVRMLCSYVQKVRTMIQAVSAYTNRKVDVIGYSLGSPIARKAILGGTCVDKTSVNLGAPLTSLIDTFVSTGGANQGSSQCTGLGLLALAGNSNNGLRCNSTFLNNVNAQSHYEGDHTFGIYSTDDEVVGNTMCSPVVQAAALNGADQNYVRSGKTHDQILKQSRMVQLQLITVHHENGYLHMF